MFYRAILTDKLHVSPFKIFIKLLCFLSYGSTLHDVFRALLQQQRFIFAHAEHSVKDVFLAVFVTDIPF